MGTNRAKNFSGWEERLVGNKFFLYNHPDLEVNYIQKGEKELYILGFILDPYNPRLMNKSILKEILLNCESFENVLSYTDKYSGRWALIWKDKAGIKIMNDACGARQVYFYSGENGVWCGSQPAILAYELGLETDDNPELIRFINSKEYRTTNFDWYGDETVYKNIRHLLPNHYLDMNSLETRRFWPNAALNNLEIADAVKEASHILEGTLKSVANRFDKVMLSVTAGYDSRMVLAASKTVKDKIKYFFCMDDHNQKSIDYKVSSQLLTSLGLKQEIITKIPMDAEFLEIYNQNVTLASKEPFKEFIYSFYKDYSDYIHVSGVCGEITRNFWYYNYDKGVSLEELISVSKYRGLTYMEKSISKWFEDAESVKNRINLYDLYFWENISGNWGAKSCAEQDIAIEEVWPYNNRKLMTALLSTGIECRKPPFYKLQREIVKCLWKETLCKPINPNILKKTLWLIKNSTIRINQALQRLKRNDKDILLAKN